MIRKATLQVGIPALLAFITWNAYLAVTHLKRVQTIAALTLESSAIQAELSGVVRDVTDMETSERGYLLTGNPGYLCRFSLLGSVCHRVEQRYSTCRSADFLDRLPKVPLARRLSRLPGTKQAAI